MKVTIGRALNLLNFGFSIMAIGNNKIPLGRWKSYQNTPITAQKLQKDSEDKDCNGFGIITGYNGLECIDVDLKVFESLQDQKDFWNQFISMLQDHIDDFDRKFVIYKTVNSGYHIIYRCNEIEGNKKLATLKGHKQAIIETRGTGGYIFIYDNQISKLAYEDVQLISEDDRVVLFGICKYFHYQESVDVNLPVVENQGLSPWDDFNRRNKASDIIADEFDNVRNLSDRYALRKKGSKDPLHGYIYKDTDLCYLFTTATIYPHEKALSAFYLYTYKYHNGDFKEATRQVYKDGYGERKVNKIEIEKPEIPNEDLIFPLDVFPEDIQSYILQNQKTLDHSIDYMGSSFLWLIAICVGNACKIEIKTGWRESANIWIGLIGKAGLGKTPSINAITFPIEKKNEFEIKHYQNEYRRWREYEGLTTKEKKDHEKIEEPVRKQLIVNDVTIEALADLHEQNLMGLGVFKDELNGWLKDMNKYKPGSDLEFWLSCWSNKQAILTRKTAKSAFIGSPLIPVLGGIQPGIFSQISTEENKDNGFLDRLLVSYPEKEIEYYNKNSINQEVIDWYEGYVMNFFDQIRNNVMTIDKFGNLQPRILRFSEKAENQWQRIFNKITDMQNSDNENEYVKSMLSKQKSYLARFCLLLNCIWAYDGKSGFDWVEEDIILKAEKLSDYFIAMSRKIKVNILETGELKSLIKSLNGEPKEVIIRNVFETYPDAKKSEVAEMLNCSRKTIYKYLKK